MEGYLAQVIGFAGNFAPRNWAFCNGQLLSISQNTALFSILGTTYGGDGRTTFGLPDLRGRTMIGPGNGPGLPTYREGQKGGEPTVTLIASQMPSHTHTAKMHAEKGLANETDPANRYLAKSSDGSMIYADPKPADDVAMAAGTVIVDNAGGNQAHDNMQPYTAIYYVICLQGIFPSRS